MNCRGCGRRRSWCSLKYDPGICWREGIKLQNSGYAVRDLNPEPPETEAEVVLLDRDVPFMYTSLWVLNGGDDGEKCSKDRHKFIYEDFNFKKPSSTRSVFLTAVLLKIQVFWDVRQWQLVNTDVSDDCSALIFKAKQSKRSEGTLVTIYQWTRPNIPEDLNLQSLSLELSVRCVLYGNVQYPDSVCLLTSVE